jgi:hypothetical protein
MATVSSGSGEWRVPIDAEIANSDPRLWLATRVHAAPSGDRAAVAAAVLAELVEASGTPVDLAEVWLKSLRGDVLPYVDHPHDGQTALYRAVRLGRRDCVKELVSWTGVAVHPRRDDPRTPFSLALHLEDQPSLWMFIEAATPAELANMAGDLEPYARRYEWARPLLQRVRERRPLLADLDISHGRGIE